MKKSELNILEYQFLTDEALDTIEAIADQLGENKDLLRPFVLELWKCYMAGYIDGKRAERC